MDKPEINNPEGEDLTEDVVELMESHDIDSDTAVQAAELIEEGVDEDDAVEIAENL